MITMLAGLDTASLKAPGRRAHARWRDLIGDKALTNLAALSRRLGTGADRQYLLPRFLPPRTRVRSVCADRVAVRGPVDTLVLSTYSRLRKPVFQLCDRPRPGPPCIQQEAALPTLRLNTPGSRAVLPIALFGTVLAIGSTIERLTPAGRKIYAIGGNLEAARLSGLRINRIRWILYISSGMSAALAATIITSQLGSSSPQIGTTFLLSVVTAVILGGASLQGGNGSGSAPRSPSQFSASCRTDSVYFESRPLSSRSCSARC